MEHKSLHIGQSLWLCAYSCPRADEAEECVFTRNSHSNVKADEL